jgi:hypothetical protein
MSASGYLAKNAPTARGSYMKFGKGGEFTKTSDGSVVPENTHMVVPFDQIEVGFTRFNGRAQAPDRKMGRVFDGFVPPDRAELGDNDPELWEKDLGGRPSDPWVSQLMVPMQDVATGDMYIFVTSSATGRSAVNNLIAQCERMQKHEPDFYPVIKLAIGGFQHRDSRVGWVKTPAFPRVGKAPRADVSAAATSASDDMSDSVPF